MKPQTSYFAIHSLSEAILYQEKPLDLNNTLMNYQYLENFVCQVLVLQSIATVDQNITVEEEPLALICLMEPTLL